MPSGLNQETYDILMRDLKKKPYTDLISWKSNIMTFVDACRVSDIIPQNLLFPLCLIGYCENNSQLKMKAEMLVRRLDKVDFNDKDLITQLFGFFLGSPANTAQPKKKTAVGESLRLLILDQFLKSKLSCNSFPLTLQVIFESLFGVNRMFLKI